MKIEKLAFAIHSFGWIHPKAYANHMGALLEAKANFDVMFIAIDGVRTAEGRNKLVRVALDNKCSHIFFVDADHLLSNEAVITLASNTEGCVVVSGLVCKRKAPYAQVGFILKDEQYYPVVLPLDGRSYKVDVPAMGCTLIDLKVFDNLEYPFFRDTAVQRSDTGEVYNKRSDINFFEQLSKMGYDLRIDTRVLVKHLGEAEEIDPVDHYPALFNRHKATLVNESLLPTQKDADNAYENFMREVACED